MTNKKICPCGNTHYEETRLCGGCEYWYVTGRAETSKHYSAFHREDRRVLVERWARDARKRGRT